MQSYLIIEDPQSALSLLQYGNKASLFLAIKGLEAHISGRKLNYKNNVSARRTLRDGNALKKRE
jgi:hypothetical protein